MSSIKLGNETKKVIDLNVSTLSYDEVLDSIFDLASQRFPSYVCFANAHMAVEARWNKNIADSVNNATIVTSDGMSVVMALKYLHRVKQDRTAGMDMIYDLVEGAERNNLSIFLFGSEKYIVDGFISKATKECPKLKIVGAIAPPFEVFSEAENNKFVEAINESGANIVFVSLGCPKQERWMAENSSKINATLLGLGGAFPLYANKTKRAPVFMQKNGFEWAYRLWQEPKRLWKRYLVTNTLFIFYFLKQFFGGKKS